MGSSSRGSSSSPPGQPTPAGLQVPYGQTSPTMQPMVSFLPSDPTAMATGLTPEMVQAINTPTTLLTPQTYTPPPAPARNSDDMRGLLSLMMSRSRDPQGYWGGGTMGYNYRGGANRSGGGGFGGGVGSSGGGGYSTSGRR